MRVDGCGIHIEPPSQVIAKAQAVQEGSSTQDALEAVPAHEVGQRVGRIGNNQNNGIRHHAEKLRHYLTVYLNILVKEPKPA